MCAVAVDTTAWTRIAATSMVAAVEGSATTRTGATPRDASASRSQAELWSVEPQQLQWGRRTALPPWTQGWVPELTHHSVHMPLWLGAGPEVGAETALAGSGAETTLASSGREGAGSSLFLKT